MDVPPVRLQALACPAFCPMGDGRGEMLACFLSHLPSCHFGIPLDEGRRGLDSPFVKSVTHLLGSDHFAKLCGIELLSVSPGQAKSRMVLQPCHLNGYGTVQGGAIFTLADFTFAAAANAHGRVAVAINVSINFITAARGGTLFAEARELGLNPKLGTYTVDVTDEAGNRVAVFQGLAYRKKETVDGFLAEKATPKPASA